MTRIATEVLRNWRPELWRKPDYHRYSRAVWWGPERNRADAEHFIEVVFDDDNLVVSEYTFLPSQFDEADLADNPLDADWSKRTVAFEPVDLVRAVARTGRRVVSHDDAGAMNRGAADLTARIYAAVDALDSDDDDEPLWEIIDKHGNGLLLKLAADLGVEMISYGADEELVDYPPEV